MELLNDEEKGIEMECEVVEGKVLNFPDIRKDSGGKFRDFVVSTIICFK